MRALLESDVSLYKILIEYAHVLIIASDIEGKVLVWNKAAEKLTGRLKKDIVGNARAWEYLYPDETYRRKVLSFIGANATQECHDVEFILFARNGAKKTVSWSAIPIRSEAGAIVGSFAVGIDVTLKNVIKQRERESFRALLKTVRVQHETKDAYEKLIASLKTEVNDLCRALSVPPRYP